MGDESYPRRRHLRQRADFVAAYDRGLRVSGRMVILYGLWREDGEDWRLGITATRKLGRAVKRNRVRRRVREWARRHQPSLPAGWDFVAVARRESVEADFHRLSEDLTRCLDRLLRNAGVPGRASTDEVRSP